MQRRIYRSVGKGVANNAAWAEIEWQNISKGAKKPYFVDSIRPLSLQEGKDISR